jgi:antitoxin (DNA-binding transcriptional repressor) of toxin-antitoxin stability system
MDVSIRELKANPAKAIAAMRGGERVRITSHRKVVAELVPPGGTPEVPDVSRSDDAQALARLLASGLVAQPATQPFQLPEPMIFPPSPDGRTMSDLVIEGRGPR